MALIGPPWIPVTPASSPAGIYCRVESLHTVLFCCTDALSTDRFTFRYKVVLERKRDGRRERESSKSKCLKLSIWIW